MTNEKNAPILYEVEGSIARLTLNRPEKRNALNRELIEALKDGLKRADGESRVRSILLNGNGPDFCAGADLTALQQMASSKVRDNLEDAQALLELFLLIRNVAVPVISAVKGRALAGGCGLALACDIVLAAQSARFGFPEVRIGFVPAMVTAILRRNVSEKRAFELLTSANEVSAEEAYRLGLVNSVFDERAFDSDSVSFARKFEKVSKSAVAMTKRLLYKTDSLTIEEALNAGADINAIARMSEDCRQGIEKFLKKARNY